MFYMYIRFCRVLKTRSKPWYNHKNHDITIVVIIDPHWLWRSSLQHSHTTLWVVWYEVGGLHYSAMVLMVAACYLSHLKIFWIDW